MLDAAIIVSVEWGQSLCEGGIEVPGDKLARYKVNVLTWYWTTKSVTASRNFQQQVWFYLV